MKQEHENRTVTQQAERPLCPVARKCGGCQLLAMELRQAGIGS